MAETVKHVSQMGDEEYCEFVRMQPTAYEVITLALRESRFVSYWFPPYSSGATDMIESWMEELKTEWKEEAAKPKPEPILNRLAEDADFFGYGGRLCEPIDG